jgi:hypothetical protein
MGLKASLDSIFGNGNEGDITASALKEEFVWAPRSAITELMCVISQQRVFGLVPICKVSSRKGTTTFSQSHNRKYVVQSVRTPYHHSTQGRYFSRSRSTYLKYQRMSCYSRYSSNDGTFPFHDFLLTSTSWDL